MYTEMFGPIVLTQTQFQATEQIRTELFEVSLIVLFSVNECICGNSINCNGGTGRGSSN